VASEPESLFNFGRAGVCVVISEVKPLVIFGCLDCSRSLKRSRILKFEKLPDPVSSEISDLRNFWLHTKYASTDWYSSWQIRW